MDFEPRVVPSNCNRSGVRESMGEEDVASGNEEGTSRVAIKTKT